MRTFTGTLYRNRSLSSYLDDLIKTLFIAADSTSTVANKPGQH